ncbi:hypothetical protein [Ideonella sp.]|uniref:hypothetical protein n=1 Tax=Ideonella sp. TaxID=1929293 RepID=UPI002B46F87E|nr:hypothetical protein [Ideonella sp.]HJV69011.1 hypothetical protein [Ideonella sp.]
MRRLAAILYVVVTLTSLATAAVQPVEADLLAASAPAMADAWAGAAELPPPP